MRHIQRPEPACRPKSVRWPGSLSARVAYSRSLSTDSKSTNFRSNFIDLDIYKVGPWTLSKRVRTLTTMFDDFSFGPAQRKRQFYDPDRQLNTGDIDPIDDGSVSPTDASSRGSSPTYYDTFFPPDAPTSTPRHGYNSRYGRQMSVTELSQHFHQHTIQSGRRASAIAPTSIPLMLKTHDPTHLAVLSTSHSNRIARQRTSATRRCSAAHLEKISSMVEQYLDHEAAPISLPRRRSVAEEVELEDPDDDFHPSVMVDEDDGCPPTSPTSFSVAPISPDEGLGAGSGFYDLADDWRPLTPPLLPGESRSRRGSTVKPVRLRRRTTLTKSRLSISK